jgi:hypothetical protein
MANPAKLETRRLQRKVAFPPTENRRPYQLITAPAANAAKLR